MSLMDPLKITPSRTIRGVLLADRDASSAAVFGARSAAGVLMINTKSGMASDKMTISFSAKVGLEGFTNLILPNNLDGYLQRREDYLVRMNGEKQKGYYSHPEEASSLYN